MPATTNVATAGAPAKCSRPAATVTAPIPPSSTRTRITGYVASTPRPCACVGGHAGVAQHAGDDAARFFVRRLRWGDRGGPAGDARRVGALEPSERAGAPGFEPGIAGPKPAALPLGHAPWRFQV